MEIIKTLAIVLLCALLIAVVMAVGSLILEAQELGDQGWTAVSEPAWEFDSVWSVAREFGFDVVSEGADLSGIGIGLDLWESLLVVAGCLISITGAYWAWRGLRVILS